MRHALLITIVGTCWLTACQDAREATASDAPESVIAEPTPKEGASLPAHHARIIDLIEAGDRALEAGDAEALMSVANKLQSMGAAPHAGTEDLARRWEVRAREMTPDGVRDAAPFRGRIKGPAYRREALAPGAESVIEDIFYAAEPAEMTLQVTGPALRWEITQDESEDGPVCNQSVTDAVASCEFMPLWTSRYRIRISNLSDQRSTYLFVTN